MATGFRSEVVVEACDGAAIGITNNFPFLAELGRLSPVLPGGFPRPEEAGPTHGDTQDCISLGPSRTSPPWQTGGPSGSTTCMPSGYFPSSV